MAGFNDFLEDKHPSQTNSSGGFAAFLGGGDKGGQSGITPQKDAFSYSPEETESMRQQFVGKEDAGIHGTVQRAKNWLQSPTPESTGNMDWATRVVPSSAAKTAVGIPTAIYETGKDIIKGGKEEGISGIAKGVWKGVKGVGEFMGEKTGILPPSPGSEGDPNRDYGTGLPGSVQQWADRFKHEVRTDPVGVVAAAEGVKGIPKTV